MTPLTSERIKSVGVLAASLVTTLNATLALIGWNPLPFTDTQAGTAVSLVLSVGVDVWAWWRQNVITQAAAVGHDVTTSEKAAARRLTGDHSSDSVAAQQNTQATEATDAETSGLTDGELKILTAAWRARLDSEQGGA